MLAHLTALALAGLLAAPTDATVPNPFEVKHGSTIVWIGNTLVEREQRYGYWESALLAHRDVTFRNLGWSGDTVFGDSRAGFEDAAKGFERLVALTRVLRPTVIFVSYGTNESFGGEAGLPAFEKGLNKLLDALAPTKARIVLFSPLPFAPDAPGADARNANLRAYSQVIRKTAAARQLRFADLFGTVTASRRLTQPGPERLTENGMHLTAAGYRATVPDFLASLGLEAKSLDGLKFEALRKAVVEKNELFFHRWRPQNQTYLFGFRKHEQGKNAKEVAEFDPLVDRAEAEITKARRALTK